MNRARSSTEKNNLLRISF